ncbi:MAG: LysR family transcriptional regulator [Collimonas sp.]
MFCYISAKGNVLDVRFLQSLVAVMETGSIAAAARQENLTAAAVSQRIQALEKIFSCTLLIRSAHTVRPSEQCFALLPKIRELIRLTMDLQEGLVTESLSGELHIGAISTALTGIFPATMAQLAAMAPALQLKITPGVSRMLYEQVVADELDGAILVQPPFELPKTLRCDILRSEPLLLLSKQAVAKEKIQAALLDRPFIRYDANAWGGQIAFQYLIDNGLDPVPFCELDSLEAILILVAKGMGVSLVPAWAGLKDDDIHALPVSDAGLYIRHLVLLRKISSRRPQALEVLRVCLGDSE